MKIIWRNCISKTTILAIPNFTFLRNFSHCVAPRERLIVGWNVSEIFSYDTLYDFEIDFNSGRGDLNEVLGKERKGREMKKRKIDAEGPRCRVIGIYLVGSQNSPAAAPSSLGNFLNSDPPARDVFCRFIFSPRDNRAQHTRVSRRRRIPHVLSFFPPLPPFSAFFSQFILRCLSARLDLSTYKWRSFVRLC